jgi:hypothetical protein
MRTVHKPPRNWSTATGRERGGCGDGQGWKWGGGCGDGLGSAADVATGRGGSGAAARAGWRELAARLAEALDRRGGVGVGFAES